jgi:hypothetical protein
MRVFLKLKQGDVIFEKETNILLDVNSPNLLESAGKEITKLNESFCSKKPIVLLGIRVPIQSVSSSGVYPACLGYKQ